MYTFISKFLLLLEFSLSNRKATRTLWFIVCFVVVVFPYINLIGNHCCPLNPMQNLFHFLVFLVSLPLIRDLKIPHAYMRHLVISMPHNLFLALFQSPHKHLSPNAMFFFSDLFLPYADGYLVYLLGNREPSSTHTTKEK